VVDVNQQVFVELNRLDGVEVALLMPAHWKSEYSGEAITPKLLPDVTFPVFPTPVAKPGHISLHFYTKLPLAEIRTFAPDIILSTQEPWSLSGLQAMYLATTLKVPFVFHTNQNIYKHYPPPFGWIENASYKRTATALAYSEEARQVMLQKGLQRPSQVVPYSTDTRLFHRRDSSALRAQLGITGKTVVGYLGRLVPEKGIDTIITALAELQANPETTDVCGLIVGSGVQENALRQQAREAGIAEKVIFTGAVSHGEAPHYMSCLDIFVLPSRTTPSWKEQFGRVIIEALASGIPVVGSDSGQIPHLIRETGGGMVFPEGDSHALASVLRDLMVNPAERTRLATVGAETVQQRFTCEAVAQQLRDVLQAQVPHTAPIRANTTTESTAEVGQTTQ